MNNTTSLSSFCSELLQNVLKNKQNVTREQILQLAACFPVAKIRETIIDKNGEKRDALILAYSLILLITSILGAIGNLAVIIFYAKKLKSLSPWKFLNLHLACCDFLFSLMQIVQAAPSFSGEIGSLKWPFGLAMCKITRAAMVLGGLIAVQNILIIAFERYKGITHPLGQIVNARKRVKIALIVAWMISLLSIVPIILVFKIDENGACEPSWLHHKEEEIAYSIYLLLVFGLMPLLAVAYLYGNVIRELQNPKGRNAIYSNLSAAEICKRRNAELRVIKMLVAVVVAFFLCVMPRRIAEVIISFIAESKLSYNHFFTLVYSGFLPYPLHVAINPFIYTLGDKDFREALSPKCQRRLTSQMSKSRATGSSNFGIQLSSFKGLRQGLSTNRSSSSLGEYKDHSGRDTEKGKLMRQ